MKTIALLACLVGLCACVSRRAPEGLGEQPGPGVGGGPSTDGAMTPGGSGQTGGCSPACPEGQVCSGEACVDLPSQCPCPAGAYCDLASNSCKPGCATDADCATVESCVNHVCGDHCPDCDDFDPCTVDTCTHGSCDNEPGNDGASCGTPSACEAWTCNAGDCEPSPINEGAACDTGACVESSKCVSGDCQPTYKADGTSCGTAGARALCVDGDCAAVLATCESSQYGSNWQPGGWSARWDEGSSVLDGRCSCSLSEVLSGPGHTMACTDCRLVSTSLYNGGATSGSGITDYLYACF